MHTLPGSNFYREISDRICGSVVWRDLAGELRNHIFFAAGEKLHAGFVLSPIHNKLNCAYAGDGGSNRRSCNPLGLSSTCVPGCMTRGMNGGFIWCNPDPRAKNSGQCAWQPQHLDLPMQGQWYGGVRSGINELVFDQNTFEINLPHSVEAVFWDDQRTDGVKERAVHRKFCETFGLSLDQVPFVRLGVGNGGQLFFP